MGGHGGQEDEQNDAGLQGARPRSKGARTGQNGLKAGVQLVFAGLPAWGGQNKRNLPSERWQSHTTGAGQGALSDSGPNWGGPALQCPPNPRKATAPKKNERDRGTEKGFGEGLVRQIQNKKRTYHWMRNFCLSCASLSPLSIAPPTIG